MRIGASPLLESRAPAAERLLDSQRTASSAAPGVWAYRIVWWFAFLGPIGKLLLIPGAPNSFRFYYFLLPPAVLFFVGASARKTLTALLPAFPLVIAVLLSAIFADPTVAKESLTVSEQEGASLPVLHALLFVSLLLFSTAAAQQIFRVGAEAKVRLVEAYMCGYFISLVCGWLFVVGRVTGLMSEDFISMFSITNDSQTLLNRQRFAPGSYPNEYGNVSSFMLSIIPLYFLTGMHLSERRAPGRPVFGSIAVAIVAVPFTFMALILASTRAAFVSFVLAAAYVLGFEFLSRLRRLSVSRRWLTRGVFVCLALGAAALISLPLLMKTDLGDEIVWRFKRVNEGMQDASQGEGSIQVRLDKWAEGERRFEKTPLIGSGFATHTCVHNTYLQLLYDMGIGGASFFVAIMALLFVLGRRRLGGGVNPVFLNNDMRWRFLRYVRSLGLLHVFWFAASNHNLDHHLTWFIAILALCVP